ncbi:Actinorhodin polyketide putative beta-ketoacyl s ynthase [Micromonospora saelicesensis]|uniref:ketosynthase chain-length factor n=1 Tax=Micromonospora TaxID=1873 RepID=UPI000DC0182F|nr:MULTISPECIES: ketosynthase chain-length factor [Micromonospora]RAO29275.1 Actinorhodin polyketide putative beta-ketoacyl s ynthase [Micromonospora noduli]RAO40444.1 Actinorhodin polyketide putative beta-ketoacyl s ynthase [Micromonospora saelicesensis]RAO56432.1 Actinorhodin polyketide putative beta-ketoacyl s ynthase [Micromonospora saelicesensis]
MTTVVTGVGVAAPNGLGRDAFWAATVAGVGGIGPISRFDPSGYPAQLAGEVPGYEAADHIPSRLMAQTDHMTRLSLTAAQWALADASVDPSALPEFGMGVVTASASGGFEFGHRELEKLWSKGSEHVSAYQSFAWFYAVNTGQISIRHGMRGPTGVLVTEQAGGLDAVAQARRQVRKGVQLVMTGGVDASLCPWGWTAQLANGLLSTGRDPATAFLPFDANASGYVPGEGGAILVLEDELAAARRGAAVYGVIAGYGATFDPRPGSGRPPGLRRAAEMAVSDAGLTPADIDVVFADGAGVAELDRVEAEAITAVFGPRGVPVTAPKTMTGRLYSGGAALDLVSALLSIRHGVIPPTTNIRQPAEGLHLDLVRDVARETPVRAALVLARGYGGFNAAMVVTDERNGR